MLSSIVFVHGVTSVVDQADQCGPGKAKLAGSSLFASTRVGHGSCQWSFTRTSLSETDPALTGCTARCSSL